MRIKPADPESGRAPEPAGKRGQPAAAVAPPSGAVHGWMSALADATRTRLLVVLARHELSVNELCEALGLPQSTVSRHLSVLSREGWVATRAEGTSRYYRLARLEPAAQRLWGAVREELERSAESAEDEARALQAIELRRTALDRLFAPDTTGWEAERLRLFGAGVEFRAFPALFDPSWVVADLGCGTGIVTQAVAPHVRRVIGVDASPYQLKEAKRRLRHLENVELKDARLEALPLETDSVDVALIVLVLHYLPEPQQALAEAVRVVRPHGRVLVLDMTQHGREEYRLRLGHVWQGFARDQMTEWLQGAGLVGVHYHELAQDRNAEGPPLFTATGTKQNGKPTTERRR